MATKQTHYPHYMIMITLLPPEIFSTLEHILTQIRGGKLKSKAVKYNIVIS